MKETTIAKCEQVANLIKDGMGIYEAADKVGVSPGTFREWRRGTGQYMRTSTTVEGIAAEIEKLESRRASMVRVIDEQIEAKRARLGRLLADRLFAEAKVR